MLIVKKILLFAVVSVLIVSVSVTSISAQSQYDIPAWVKGIAGFWAEDKISDSEFGEGLSFLIDSNIIKVPLIQELQNEISQLESTVTQLETENKELRSKDYSNTSIPKIVSTSSNTYTNSIFGFSLVHPSGWTVEENPVTMDEDKAGIVAISLYTNIPLCDFAPGLIVHYFKEEPINVYDTETRLLDYFESLIYFDDSTQTKLIDREIVKLRDGYKLTYTFNDIVLFPEIEMSDGTICVEEFITVQNQYVIFQYNNGDRYDVIFSSEDLHYDDSVLEFEKTANTFKRVN